MTRHFTRTLAASLALALAMLVPATGFAQAFTTLHNFAGSPDGSFPLGSLIQGLDGNLYGATERGGTAGTIFRIAPDGSGYTTLYSLPGNAQVCLSGLSQGSDGTLYGASLFGGNPLIAGGCVFKAQPDGSGSITVLYSFTNGSDGAWPHGAPIPGGDGFVYGATQAGGSSPGTSGFGTLYKLATDGSSFQVLHTFNGADGASAFGQLLLGSDGFLYGTTGGGANGLGTVFKVDRDGSGFQVLHSFNGQDGNDPVAALVQGPDGTLYGTTDGATDGSNGMTVFRLATDGTGFATLATFPPYSVNNSYNIIGVADQLPRATVVMGPDGNLYGSCVAGGTNGTLYRVAPNGTGFTTLYTFSSLSSSNTNADGAYPLAAMFASNGNLYGTAPGGGTSGNGTLFEFVPVTYTISALYDQTKAVKQGACFPIKIELLNASGVNVSSSSITVHATGVALLSGVSGALEDVGNANPDNDFRYDATLQGYIFNLSTAPLSSGTWVLSFTAGSDPTVHTVQFGVK